jgi:tRNA A-37 threonylcarbamoyl transferase component Bud32
MSLRRTLQGHDGPIAIDAARRTVTKIYSRPVHADAVQAALREAEHARRFRQALLCLHGVRCPSVIAVDLRAPPRVVLELCAGEPLAEVLRRSPLEGGDLACRIHDALVIYVRELGPYYDLCFNNLLYDGDSGWLTFLDFGVPGRGAPDSTTPLESSLASLVGCACYELARPTALLAQKPHSLRLLAAVLSRFEGEVSRARVLGGARKVFRQLSRPGGFVRRAYYGTAGVLASRTFLARLERAISRPHAPARGSGSRKAG